MISTVCVNSKQRQNNTGMKRQKLTRRSSVADIVWRMVYSYLTVTELQAVKGTTLSLLRCARQWCRNTRSVNMTSHELAILMHQGVTFPAMTTMKLEHVMKDVHDLEFLANKLLSEMMPRLTSLFLWDADRNRQRFGSDYLLECIADKSSNIETLEVRNTRPKSWRCCTQFMLPLTMFQSLHHLRFCDLIFPDQSFDHEYASIKTFTLNHVQINDNFAYIITRMQALQHVSLEFCTEDNWVLDYTKFFKALVTRPLVSLSLLNLHFAMADSMDIIRCSVHELIVEDAFGFPDKYARVPELLVHVSGRPGRYVALHVCSSLNRKREQDETTSGRYCRTYSSPVCSHVIIIRLL